MSPSTALHVIELAHSRRSTQYDHAVRLLAYGRSTSVLAMASATAPLFALAA